MTAALEVPDGQLIRRGGVLTAAKVATLVLQTAHLGVLARAVAPSAFAALAAALAVLVILGALAEFGLVHSSVLALAEGEDEARVVRATLVGSAKLTTVAVAIAGIVSLVLLDGDARSGVLFLAPWFVLSRLDSALVAVHQFRLRTTRLALAEVASRAILLGSAIPLLVHGGSWSTSRELLVVAVGFGLSEIVSLAMLAPGVKWRGCAPEARDRRILRRALPLGLANATSLVHSRSDQVVLEVMGRRSGLAAYAIAFRVNEAMLALAGAAGTVTFPTLARAEPSARTAQARRVIGAACSLAVLAGVAVFFAAPWIAEVVGGGRYDEAAHLSRLLVPGLAASMVNLPIAQLVIVCGGTGRLLRLAIVAVAVNLVLTVTLVAQLGASGAAAATSISEVGVLLVGGTIATRLAPGAVPWAQVVVVPLLVSAPLWIVLDRWRAGDAVSATAVGGLVLAGLWANHRRMQR